MFWRGDGITYIKLLLNYVNPFNDYKLDRRHKRVKAALVIGETNNVKFPISLLPIWNLSYVWWRLPDHYGRFGRGFFTYSPFGRVHFSNSFARPHRTLLAILPSDMDLLTTTTSTLKHPQSKWNVNQSGPPVKLAERASPKDFLFRTVVHIVFMRNKLIWKSIPWNNGINHKSKYQLFRRHFIFASILRLTFNYSICSEACPMTCCKSTGDDWCTRCVYFWVNCDQPGCIVMND